jgi:hypothetical protein
MSYIVAQRHGYSTPARTVYRLFSTTPFYLCSQYVPAFTLPRAPGAAPLFLRSSTATASLRSSPCVVCCAFSKSRPRGLTSVCQVCSYFKGYSFSPSGARSLLRRGRTFLTLLERSSGAHGHPSWQFAACSSTGGRVVLRMHREARSLGGTSLEPLRHSHAQSEVFALTTIAPEPDRGSLDW